jgi:2-iminobutanoate/2-iminopropanoate deaminase
MLFISGQIAINPATNELVMDSIALETEQVMKNLKAILETAGSSFSQVVKTGIFLSSMDHFSTVNDVYSQYMVEPYPARETVAVKGLPRQVNVEISMIALIPA